MANFEEILSRSTLFVNKNVLSPHYIPEFLPFRDEYVEQIMRILSPALKGQKPKNLFIYGKTGTGKTCSIKLVMDRFNRFAEEKKLDARMLYINCRVYNSRYRIMNKAMKFFVPELEKTGFGLTFIYEKLIELLNGGMELVVVLDEIDMVKDLDDLVYTITRANDEVGGKKGGVTVVGISNKLSFKNELDPRSKSSLYESEIIFPPYTAPQLKSILEQRVEIGFRKNSVSQGAVNLIAAITAQETGDARYALKLLERAGETAENAKKEFVEERDVEEARKRVEYDIASEAIATLPINQQLVLYAVAKLSATARFLDPELDGYLFSGDVYNNYMKMARKIGRKPKSARWYREYINELEALGLISTMLSGKGIKGRTRLIKIGHNADDVIRIVEKNAGLG
ncbi:MAG: Cdc6/Cdc18 family protein [Candidatus Anstonellales archaeon]